MILVVSGEKDDLHVGAEPADLFGCMKNVEPGHFDIEDEDVRLVVDDRINRFRGGSYGIKDLQGQFFFECVSEEFTLAGMIIRNDDGSGFQDLSPFKDKVYHPEVHYKMYEIEKNKP